MKSFLRFVREKVLGLSSKPVEQWGDSDFAHDAALSACLFVLGIAIIVTFLANDLPLLAVVEMIFEVILAVHLVVLLAAWAAYRDRPRRP